MLFGVFVLCSGPVPCFFIVHQAAAENLSASFPVSTGECCSRCEQSLSVQVDKLKQIHTCLNVTTQQLNNLQKKYKRKYTLHKFVQFGAGLLLTSGKHESCLKTGIYFLFCLMLLVTLHLTFPFLLVKFRKTGKN